VFLDFFLFSFAFSGDVMKHRRRIEILAEVLAVSLKGAKKTHIMNRSNLNFKLVNSYLKVVLSSGLLMFDSAEDSYFVTPKGKRFLIGFKDYKRHLRKVENKLKIVEEKKDLLEQMCFPINTCDDVQASE
jgi:predicted transcriptional regulator